MNVPIIMLVGNAGVGKDTIANQMVEYGGIAIAQADPLKRFAQFVFGFTTEQLWGPSELRNAETDNKVDEEALEEFSYRWLSDIGMVNKLGPAPAGFRLKEWRHRHINGRKLSPRHVLQTLGTEFGRAAWPEVWVEYAQRMALKLLTEGGSYDREIGYLSDSSRPSFVVITDGRFANEIIATKRNGGLVIKIIDPQPSHLFGNAGKHASEVEQNTIHDSWYDIIFSNDKADGKQKLSDTVNSLVINHILPRPISLGTWQ